MRSRQKNGTARLAHAADVQIAPIEAPLIARHCCKARSDPCLLMAAYIYVRAKPLTCNTYLLLWFSLLEAAACTGAAAATRLIYTQYIVQRSGGNRVTGRSPRGRNA